MGYYVRVAKIVGAGIISIGILSIISIVYFNTGIHTLNPSGATDYKWTPHELKTNMTEGFAWFRMDENGFNNPNETIKEDLDILIMGSSHMEAVNVGKQDNAAAQLRRLIPGYNIYNIGVSGHTIYRCAKNLKNAIEEYKPLKYVIIETDTIELDNEKMNEVINNKMQDIPSYDSGVLFYIQKYCPAIKTIVKNLQDWNNISTVSNINKEMLYNKADQNILEQFLLSMKGKCGNRQLIILYHPKTEIDGNGDFIKADSGVKSFSSVCESNGIIFIDLSDDFQKLYEEQHILAHGFINTAVGTGHLNKYGHQIIAERLAQLMKEDMEP